jgi:hypothetical protein
MAFGEPLEVPRKATDEQRNALKDDLKRRMMEINPE